MSKVKGKEHSDHTSGDWGTPRDLSGRRPKGSRSRRPLVLIIVEGTRTEKLYFESLAREERASAVHVDVVHSKRDTAPENLVQQADKAWKSRIDSDKWEDDGQVWCVCDTEQPEPSVSLRNALATARKLDINMAVSNPAFEYWYLLHFRDSTSPCSNGQEMKNKLRKIISRAIRAPFVISPKTNYDLESVAKERGDSDCSGDSFRNSPVQTAETVF